jgi:hypothetical protein
MSDVAMSSSTGTSQSVADRELADLPAPRRPFRRVTFAVMGLTALAALWVALGLRGDLAYSFKGGGPRDIGELGRVRGSDNVENTWVRGEGSLSTTDVIHYKRPLDADGHRLARVENNPDLWVELRVPADADGDRFVPPASFVGRLVPLSAAGVRYGALADAVEDAGKPPLRPGTWLLLDGEAPQTTRWVIGVVLLLAGFIAFNVVGLVRLSRPIRDA